MGCDFVLEICANYLLKFLHLKNNNGIYSIAMLIEFWLYPYYYRHVLVNKMVRRIITYYLFLFPVVWFILVFILSGPGTWNSMISVIGTVVLIILSVCMYYQLFTSDSPKRLIRNFEFIVASGMIIFFASSYTLLGMLNYVITTNKDLAKQLLSVLHILNIIYYSLITYGFICAFSSARNNSL